VPVTDIFTEKVVLISGAGKGIGRALAVAFARAGAYVAANDLTPANLDGTLERIAAEGGTAKAYLADVAKSLPVQTMVNQVLEDWGRIDILINNSGVAPQSPLLDMDEWDWQRTLEVNLAGPWWLIQAVGHVMQTHSGGVMLNLVGKPDWLLSLQERSAYLTTQYGLIGLTLAAAQELQPYQIRVNALLLGAVAGPPDAQEVADFPKEWEELEHEAETPLAKVVEKVLYVCSPAAAGLNGQVLAITRGG
jgi:NAD(P)-dependent dehydrogenase (short-subunit alcohol dehydrogenase family)